MVTCPVFPSLIRGSRGSDTIPFLLTDTTLAAIVRSFHRIFPLPFPSVTHTFPSCPIRVTTSGDFSPGATPGFLGRLASIDVMGIFANEALIPSRTSTLLHPHSASREVNASAPALFEKCDTTNDVRLFISSDFANLPEKSEGGVIVQHGRKTSASISHLHNHPGRTSLVRGALWINPNSTNMLCRVISHVTVSKASAYL